jgi:PadR family transcriptional regulator PadR
LNLSEGENILSPVVAPLTTKAALLQALFAGPGYGLELIERVAERTGRRVRLGQGSVYPALRDLKAAGLVRSWTGRWGVKGAGRPRVYYELTVAGVGAASALRDAVIGFVAAGEGEPGFSKTVEARLKRGLDLSAVARSLRGRRSEGRP